MSHSFCDKQLILAELVGHYLPFASQSMSVSLSKRNCPFVCVPQEFPINGIPVVTSLQNIYWGSLKHSQIGHLEHEAWLGSLEARHTASFLRAVPESNISQTAKCTRYFLARLFECLNTPIYKAPKESCIILRRAHEGNDDGARGIESASRENTNYICPWEM